MAIVKEMCAGELGPGWHAFEGAPEGKVELYEELEEDEQDLRTPNSKKPKRARGSQMGTKAAPPPAIRAKRAVKQLVSYVVSAEGEQESGSEEKEDEVILNQGVSEEETESEGPAEKEIRRKGPPSKEKGKAKERVPMQKRAMKVKGRKRVPRKLLDGKEEFLDDEKLEEEGDVLKKPENEVGPSTSGGFRWEQVKEGDDCAFIESPEWTGSQSSMPRGQISNLSLLNPLQIFLLLAPLSYWQMVVDQTIFYAEVSRTAAAPSKKGKQRPWSLVTVQEILKVAWDCSLYGSASFACSDGLLALWQLWQCNVFRNGSGYIIEQI
jgi:hypothetical protein